MGMKILEVQTLKIPDVKSSICALRRSPGYFSEHFQEEATLSAWNF